MRTPTPAPAPRRRRLPRLRPTLPHGYARTDAAADLRAGLGVGVLVVPQSMAYAALAGVPAVAGLYAAVVGLVVYAALGTSRYASVGPVAIDSLLTAAAVAPLADGDPARYVALASLTALMVGALQVGAGLLGLSSVVGLLSLPVVSGFTSAAALTIALSQVPDLLGLVSSGPHTSALETAVALADTLTTADGATTVLGATSIALLLLLRRFAPGVPAPLTTVATMAVLVALLGLDDRVALVGQVPTGLPVPGLPDVGWADARALLPAAAAIALIGVMETVSTGTAFARADGEHVDTTREMVAVGVANAGAGLLGGIPVAGGFSRGAVNVAAGARSQLSNVVAALVVVLSLLLLAPVLAQLPSVALAAIVLVAVLGLVDWRGALRIGRVRAGDLAALVSTLLVTLAWGPAPGLAAGAAVSVALLLRSSTRPHLPELGQVPGERVFRNVSRHRVLTDPALVVLRVDAPLTFASERAVRSRVEDLGRTPGLRHLVVDCSPVTSADYTGAELLADCDAALAEQGVELHLAEVRGPVHDVLVRHPRLQALVSGGRLHHSTAHAVEHLPVHLDHLRGPEGEGR